MNNSTKTGKLHSGVGFNRTSGTPMSTSEYDKKLTAKGYTIEHTPNGKIYTPPKK